MNFIKKNIDRYSKPGQQDYPFRKARPYQPKNLPQRQQPPRQDKLKLMQNHFNEEIRKMKADIERLNLIIAEREEPSSERKGRIQQMQERERIRQRTSTKGNEKLSRQRQRQQESSPLKSRKKSTVSQQQNYQADPNPSLRLPSTVVASVPVIQSFLKSVKLYLDPLDYYVYTGYMRRTSKEVVVKFGHQSQVQQRSIKNEFNSYEIIWKNMASLNQQSFPKVIQFVQDLQFYILVLDKKGPNLLQVWKKLGYSFSDRCIAQIIIQILKILEFLHQIGLLLRNLSPNHILISQDKSSLCLIDLSQSARTMLNKRPVQVHSSKEGLFNKFSSSALIQQNNQNKYDDLQSLGYLMVYLFRRKLPWSNSDGRQGIFKIRKGIKLKSLCQGCPPQVYRYFDSMFTGKQQRRSIYGELRQILLQMRGEAGKMDWQ